MHNRVARRAPIRNFGIKSIGSAGQAGSSIRLLCEELPKVDVFSAHKIFTTFCAPFPYRIFDFKVLAIF